MSVTENVTVAPRHVSFMFPAVPESAVLARQIAAAVLRAWATAVDEFTAALLLSEVFTNALLHGVGPHQESGARIGVDLVETATGLRVEVHDPNQGETSDVLLKRSAVESESGRGLELVDALSSAWGCKHTTAGKLVFFELSHQSGGQAEVVAEEPRAALTSSPRRGARFSGIGTQRREPTCLRCT